MVELVHFFGKFSGRNQNIKVFNYGKELYLKASIACTYIIAELLVYFEATTSNKTN